MRCGLMAAMVLSGTAAWAQAGEEEVVSAFRSVGCLVMANDLDAVLASAGLTYEEAETAIFALLNEGAIIAESGSGGQVLGLSEGLCSGGDARDRLIEAVRGAGCVLDADGLARTLDTLGPSPEELRDAAKALVASGEASTAGGGLALAPSLCPPAAP